MKMLEKIKFNFKYILFLIFISISILYSIKHTLVVSSHFILGRDHTGVGDYYSNSDIKNLFSQLGDIGIVPIIFDEFVYSKKKGTYLKITKIGNEKSNIISGTNARNMFRKGKIPPSWYMREEISNYIIDSLKNGKQVFV